jgi:hypothetical protein
MKFESIDCTAVTDLTILSLLPVHFRSSSDKDKASIHNKNGHIEVPGSIQHNANSIFQNPAMRWSDGACQVARSALILEVTDNLSHQKRANIETSFGQNCLDI